MLRQLAADLWVAEQPLRFLGLEIGARMTIVRFPGSRLWLHSPLSRSPELAAEIDRLGSVEWLVAPSRFHHVFVGEWQASHPSAALSVAPGLETKRSDLTISEVLGEVPSSPAFTRLAFRLGSAYGRLSTTLLERVAIRDREAFRGSLERILAWPFSRVIVAHGSVVEAGGREQLARAYAWVLGGAGSSYARTS